MSLVAYLRTPHGLTQDRTSIHVLFQEVCDVDVFAEQGYVGFVSTGFTGNPECTHGTSSPPVDLEDVKHRTGVCQTPDRCVCRGELI